MSTLLKPCLVCGTPSDGPRCPEHAPKSAPKGSAHSRGYDAAWRRLSAKARKLQPFCGECGATEDLQTDHTPEAWERKAAGKSIRLQDVRVLCGPCNRDAGRARPANDAVRPANSRLGRPRGYAPARSPRDPAARARSALHTPSGADPGIASKQQTGHGKRVRAS